MAIDADASLRVVVSGLLKRKAGLEDDLRCFFHDVGCKVAAVRLVVDPKRAGRNRGFSFVDLEDHESLDLALKLHNQEAKGLADNDANLRVAKAHDGTDQAMKRKQGFSDARKQLEEVERKLAFFEARLNKLLQLVQVVFRVRRTFIEVGEQLDSPQLLRRKTAA